MPARASRRILSRIEAKFSAHSFNYVREIWRRCRPKAFGPKGTNVNFTEVIGENRLRIRTYERGVENETLACGTGSVATAICAVLTGRVRQPVEVETKSGELLKISFDLEGKNPANVYLEGSAHFVFEGKLLLEDEETS